MKEPETIRAVELVRKIRDEQAEELAGMTRSEIIAYFEKAGREAREEAAHRVSRTPRPEDPRTPS